METVNSFKGYGKVDEREERAFQLKSRRRIIIIGVSVVVLLAVIIGAVVGTVIQRNKNKSSASGSPITQSESIKAVCSVTQYPESCFTSLSSQLVNKSTVDPEELFRLSMKVALAEVSNLTSLPGRLTSTDPLVKAALEICREVLEDSVEQLNSSISAVEEQVGRTGLSKMKIDDLKTWISSAITNQETCLDGLEEIADNKTSSSSSAAAAKFLKQIKSAMANSTQLTSNSLAIVSKIMTVLEDLEIPIHRRLLEFPEWVEAGERRLLQQEPSLVQPDLTVAADGSGNFKTISEAVAVIGKKNKTRTVIYVKEGTYAENVLVDKAHWNVMMYGDGATKTIVSGKLNFIDGTPTFTTATFIATGRGFIAKDMAFENTAGPDKHQAVAFRSGSDQSVFYRCTFDAYQDTLYAHSNRQFYRDCDITGTIDFIFGNAAVVFQNCNIQPRQPRPNQFVTITAQGKKDVNQNTGISIHRSKITPLDPVTARTYLGRPWKDFSTTIIMETEIAAVVDPVGWISWVYNVTPPTTINYAEYKNTGPGSNVDKRVTWEGYKSTAPEEQAAQFTVEPFIQGSQWLPQTSVTFDSSL